MHVYNLNAYNVWWPKVKYSDYNKYLHESLLCAMTKWPHGHNHSHRDIVLIPAVKAAAYAYQAVGCVHAKSEKIIAGD